MSPADAALRERDHRTVLYGAKVRVFALVDVRDRECLTLCLAPGVTCGDAATALANVAAECGAGQF